MADTKISALPSAGTPLDGGELVPIVQSGATKKVTVANLTAGRAVDMGTATVNGKSILGVSAGVGGISNSGPTWNAATVQVGRGNDVSYSWMVNTATIPSDYNYNSGLGVDGTYGSNTSIINLKALGVYFGGYKSKLAIWTQSGTTLTNTFTFDDVGNLVPNTAAKGIDFTANTGAAGKTSQLLNWYEEGTWTPTDASGASLSFTVTYARYVRVGKQVTVNMFITFPSTASAAQAVIGGLPFSVASNNYPPASLASNSGTALSGIGAATAKTVSIGTAADYSSAVANSTLSGRNLVMSLTYLVD